MKFLRYLKFIFPIAGAIIGFQVALSASGGISHQPTVGSAVGNFMAVTIAIIFAILGAVIGVIAALFIHAFRSINIASDDGVKCEKCGGKNISTDTTCRYCNAVLQKINS
jgi:hypothetical protein